MLDNLLKVLPTIFGVWFSFLEGTGQGICLVISARPVESDYHTMQKYTPSGWDTVLQTPSQ